VRPFATRLEVSAPAGFAVNGVGTRVAQSESDGRRTVIWESDEPVSIFNIVAGRWEVRRGAGAAIFYHPEHAYNIDEMLRVLDGARSRYSEWFYPYPWRELKLSEFPGLASYAQGFATNITFSESIGFLTEPDPETDAVALVTAHEAAHQWWGNLLRPGDGPGGVILSEGMAHFSTVLLLEELNGRRARIGFLKRIEEDYLENRRTDDERPLVQVDYTRAGDRVLVYDKGGWVAWMLMEEMGRDPFLVGLRAFIERYKDGPDYPLLQDLVATLRPFAPDSAAFDRFVQQWFFAVVLPEYRLSDPTLEETEVGEWVARVRVTNAGTGRMPVEVAAILGKEGSDDIDEGDSGDAHWSSGDEAASPVLSRRTSVVLGAGDSRIVEIRTPFRPDRIVVDPDVRVLQLGRERARADL
jgi:aminopeptidase N